jgi:hypothetical protein
VGDVALLRMKVGLRDWGKAEEAGGLDIDLRAIAEEQVGYSLEVGFAGVQHCSEDQPDRSVARSEFAMKAVVGWEVGTVTFGGDLPEALADWGHQLARCDLLEQGCDMQLRAEVDTVGAGFVGVGRRKIAVVVEDKLAVQAEAVRRGIAG